MVSIPLILGSLVTAGGFVVLIYFLVKSKAAIVRKGTGTSLDDLLDLAKDLSMEVPGLLWSGTKRFNNWLRSKLDEGDVLEFMKKVSHEVEMVDESLYDILNSSKSLENSIKDLEKEIDKENA